MNLFANQYDSNIMELHVDRVRGDVTYQYCHDGIASGPLYRLNGVNEADLDKLASTNGNNRWSTSKTVQHLSKLYRRDNHKSNDDGVTWIQCKPSKLKDSKIGTPYE